MVVTVAFLLYWTRRARPSRRSAWEGLHTLPLLFVVPRSQEQQIEHPCSCWVPFDARRGKHSYPKKRRRNRATDGTAYKRTCLGIGVGLCHSSGFTPFRASPPHVIFKMPGFTQQEKGTKDPLVIYSITTLTVPLWGNYSQGLCWFRVLRALVWSTTFVHVHHTACHTWRHLHIPSDTSYNAVILDCYGSCG